MAKAKKSKQLNFSMRNRVGLLSEISAAIADAKVGMNAVCAYGMEGKAYFMIITDGNAKAKKALGALGADVTEDDVISVEMSNKTGELKKVAKKIADAGVNIYYMYGTAGTGKSSVCVFATADNNKAIRAINKK
jgi:hypothetical protein